jgi:hypothetical protein
MSDFFRNWFKKKVGFDFGGSIKPLTYPTPKKAIIPANMTPVAKYTPIQYNIMQGTGGVSRGQAHDDGQQETRSEPPNLPLVQHGTKVKSYTLKIQPVKFTKRIRNDLANFARMQPGLRADFLEEAKRTLAVNTGQIAEALKADLSTHIDNMRTVYDIFSTLKELDKDISAKNVEAANLIEKGAHPDAVAAVNAEIAEMQTARNGLNVNYVAPIRGQHAKGKRLVYHMKNRINKSLDEIERLESFYCTVCRTIGIMPPSEFKFDRKAEEAALIKEVFEKEIISAMKRYGLILRDDGTFEISVVDLGGEIDNGNSHKEKSEADS